MHGKPQANMGIAREGVPFIVPPMFIGGALIVIAYASGSNVWLVPAFLFLAFAIFSRAFFRDPVRIPPESDTAIVAPGDGTVKIVREIADARFPGGLATQVSIFLSVANVHVNRVPCTGKIIGFSYSPGKFLLAWEEKASTENEQTEIVIQNTHGIVVVKQIAGFVARRIICDLQIGEWVGIGERLGLIRFGSRMDLRFPTTLACAVKVGDTVVGAETLIADFAPDGSAPSSAEIESSAAEMLS